MGSSFTDAGRILLQVFFSRDIVGVKSRVLLMGLAADDILETKLALSYLSSLKMRTALHER